MSCRIINQCYPSDTSLAPPGGWGRRPGHGVRRNGQPRGGALRPLRGTGGCGGSPVMPHLEETDRLRRENLRLAEERAAFIRYIRAKVGELLVLMKCPARNADQLGGMELIGHDPIGTIAVSFSEVMDNLNVTNERLLLEVKGRERTEAALRAREGEKGRKTIGRVIAGEKVSRIGLEFRDKRGGSVLAEGNAGGRSSLSGVRTSGANSTCPTICRP